MSRLELRAKPVLLSLIKQEKMLLSTQQQQIVATWAVLKAMVGEFSGEASATIWRETREKFAHDQIIPDKMQVWLGRTNSLMTAYQHHTGAVYDPILLGPNLPLNSQISNFCVETLIIQVASTNGPASIGLTKQHAKVLRQVHPSVGPVHWPPLYFIDARTIEAFIRDRNFIDRLQGVQVLHTGINWRRDKSRRIRE